MATPQPTARLLGVPRSAWSINEFCARNGLSRASLYNYWKAGLGPRFMKVRSRRLITAEAEQDWHRERESASGAPSDKPDITGTAGIPAPKPAPMRRRLA